MSGRPATALSLEQAVAHLESLLARTMLDSEADDAAVRKVLSAISQPQAVAVPEGWALVPVDPTSEMLIAAADRKQPDPFDRDHPWGTIYRSVYRAMVSASPPAPQTEAWRPIAEAPETPGRIDVRSVCTYRWTPYHPKSDQFHRGIKGRWQRPTDHDWENADLPENGEWMPNEINPPAQAQEGGK